MQDGASEKMDANADAQGPRWLSELRPSELFALAGALVFVAYRFLCG